MTGETLLRILDENINSVLDVLNNEDKIQLKEYINDLMAAEDDEDDDAVEDATDELFDFCLDYPELKDMLMENDLDDETSDRGKPIIGSVAKREKPIRLLANRIIDAI